MISLEDWLTACEMDIQLGCCYSDLVDKHLHLIGDDSPNYITAVTIMQAWLLAN